jgi:general secretion pathway protein G
MKPEVPVTVDPTVDKRKAGLPVWVWILILCLVVGPMGLVACSIVAAIALPKLISARVAANQARAWSDIDALGRALERYVAIEGGYPESLDALVVPDDSGAQYLDLPVLPRDPWGREYLFALPGEFAPEALVYTLGADGEPGGELEGEDLVYTLPE